MYGGRGARRSLRNGRRLGPDLVESQEEGPDIPGVEAA